MNIQSHENYDYNELIIYQGVASCLFLCDEPTLKGVIEGWCPLFASLAQSSSANL